MKGSTTREDDTRRVETDGRGGDNGFRQVVVGCPENGTDTIPAEVAECPQGIEVWLNTDVILEKFRSGME